MLTYPDPAHRSPPPRPAGPREPSAPVPRGQDELLEPPGGFGNTLWSGAERLLCRQQLPGDRASAACPEPARLLAIYSGREEPGSGAASAADPPGATARPQQQRDRRLGVSRACGGAPGVGRGVCPQDAAPAGVPRAALQGCRRRPRVRRAPGGVQRLETGSGPQMPPRGAATLHRSSPGARPGADWKVPGGSCSGTGGSRGRALPAGCQPAMASPFAFTVRRERRRFNFLPYVSPSLAGRTSPPEPGSCRDAGVAAAAECPRMMLPSQYERVSARP